MNEPYSLNDSATVVLTDYGLEVFRAHHRTLRLPKHIKLVDLYPTVESTRLLTLEIWQLMEIFGSSFQQWGDIPFVKNQIEIKRSGA